ncbi:MAG: DinB family protein [Anaerolineae bacterium]|nr:DinB family protein [Anaerolineae bacterium]
MDSNLKTSIWQQFGASIDYLADTMRACPDSLWLAPLWQTPNTKPEFSQFWYVVYHTLFWLDLYLTGAEEGFLPPTPFTLIEQNDDGPLPERAYTKDELQSYLDYGRQKCRETIEALTDETAQRHCQFGWGECSFLELLVYNLRHVHGHASQLNMLLGQNGISTPDYPTQNKAS